MMKLIIQLMFSICFLVSACNYSAKEESPPFKYNIFIEFDSIIHDLPELWEIYDKNNSYLFIEEGFENDLISVYKNGIRIYNKRISSTTDGYGYPADMIDLGRESNIKNISIRVNNGNLLFTEVSESYPNFYHLFYLRKLNELNLTLFRSPPFYD